MVIKVIIKVENILKKDISDKVIIFETDTVYGIGTSIDNLDGVKQIFNIKNRDFTKPLALLCANLDQVKSVVKNYEIGEDIASKFWPGALTLIFEKQSKVDDLITSGFKTVGVRIPKSETALKILEKNGPMAVTSLNLSTEPAIVKFDECLAYEDMVDYIVFGRDLNSPSSTVYDLLNKKILRQGEIKI